MKVDWGQMWAFVGAIAIGGVLGGLLHEPAPPACIETIVDAPRGAEVYLNTSGDFVHACFQHLDMVRCWRLLPCGDELP